MRVTKKRRVRFFMQKVFCFDVDYATLVEAFFHIFVNVAKANIM